MAKVSVKMRTVQVELPAEAYLYRIWKSQGWPKRWIAAEFSGTPVAQFLLLTAHQFSLLDYDQEELAHHETLDESLTANNHYKNLDNRKS